MACLTWPFQRVGSTSTRVTGAIPKAPQPSAIHGPGCLQVEHKSSVSSESGDVNDAPRVVSHLVAFQRDFAWHRCGNLSGHEVLEREPAASVLFIIVFGHAGLSQRKLAELFRATYLQFLPQTLHGFRGHGRQNLVQPLALSTQLSSGNP